MWIGVIGAEFVQDFTAHELSHIRILNIDLDSPAACKDEIRRLSLVEKARLERAFSRYETLQQYMFRQKSIREPGKQKDLGCLADEYFHITLYYQPWEIEEINCIRRCLVKRIAKIFDRLEAELNNPWRRHIEQRMIQRGRDPILGGAHGDSNPAPQEPNSEGLASSGMGNAPNDLLPEYELYHHHTSFLMPTFRWDPMCGRVHGDSNPSTQEPNSEGLTSSRMENAPICLLPEYDLDPDLMMPTFRTSPWTNHDIDALASESLWFVRRFLRARSSKRQLEMVDKLVVSAHRKRLCFAPDVTAAPLFRERPEHTSFQGDALNLPDKA
jgi:hypothetical protein